jgi:hypothetical protein
MTDQQHGLARGLTNYGGFLALIAEPSGRALWVIVASPAAAERQTIAE